MKKSKHTPGPWYFRKQKHKNHKYGLYRILDIPNDDSIAILENTRPFADHYDLENTLLADAKLITAAPELLDTCLWIERELKKKDPDMTQIKVLLFNSIKRALGDS